MDRKCGTRGKQVHTNAQQSCLDGKLSVKRRSHMSSCEVVYLTVQPIGAILTVMAPNSQRGGQWCGPSGQSTKGCKVGRKIKYSILNYSLAQQYPDNVHTSSYTGTCPLQQRGHALLQYINKSRILNTNKRNTCHLCVTDGVLYLNFNCVRILCVHPPTLYAHYGF